MAYNNGFPMNYPQYYPQNPQTYPQQIQQPQIQQPQQTIQNGGFMLIPSEDMARTYPVAPGNCVTFKIEGKPIVMEKSMGFSQLEPPRIDRYRLVREEEVPSTPEPEPTKECHCNEDIEQLKEQFKSDIEKLWSEIDVLRGQIPKSTTTKKKDTGGN